MNKKDINYIMHKVNWLRNTAKEIEDLRLEILCMCDCIEGKFKEIRRRK